MMSEALTTTEHDDGPGVAALEAFLEAKKANYDEDSDLEPEVITGDGRHYFVNFTLCGHGAWFSPNDARFFAYELTRAADEADEKGRSNNK